MGRTQLFFLGLLMSLAGCAGDGGDINQPSGRTEPVDAISIVSGAQNKGAAAFSPNPLDISLAGGGVVQWTNNDQQEDSYGTTGTTHNITSNNAAFSPGNVTPGNSFQVTFTAAGTYGYHCSIHPTMVGEVRVSP
jgi:plastocyanin